MPEIITPKEIKAWSEAGKLQRISPSAVWDIKMSSVQELLELADSYGEKIVMKVGKKEYIFKHEGLYYYAKG